MEYLLPTRRQDFVARWLKRFSKCKVVALAHLVPEDIDSYYPTEDKLNEWCRHTDVLMTLGSSLSAYLTKRRADSKIKTAFHYVDLDYYKPIKREPNTRLKAVFMGNMKRDFNALVDIVKSCPNIDFVYLMGKSKRDITALKGLSNIEIHGYLSEDDLKKIMNESDISLNLMYDTIGSNVITTSLAMGLAMFVSDVGSIHDYCSAEDSYFCNSIDDFIKYLNNVTFDDIVKKSIHAKEKAQTLSVKCFYELIKTF